MEKKIVHLLDTSHPFTTFTPDEVKELESLPGETWKTEVQLADELVERGREFLKTIKSSRRQLFRQEADKRVFRYFIGQSGWVWFVHVIVDIPEFYDTAGNKSKSLYEAKDGSTTMHWTSLYMTEKQARDNINDDIRDNIDLGDETLTHVYELDKM
jgi:hypothetical protein